MSTQNATRLIEGLRQDQALAKRFKDAGEAGFEAMARQQGLECTVAEMREAIKAARASTELSEKDLEKVAGAGDPPFVGIHVTVV